MKCYILMMFFAVNLTQSCETQMQLTYTTNGDILMMRCEILEYSCCKHIKNIEFLKNGEGVCSVANCDGRYDVPLTRRDTELYKCGCTGLNMDEAYFITTNVGKSDYGEWSCRCNNVSDVIEDQSNVIVIRPDYSTFSTAAPLVVPDGTDLKVIIGAVLGVMFILILYLLAKAAIFCDLKKKLKRFLKLLRHLDYSDVKFIIKAVLVLVMFVIVIPYLLAKATIFFNRKENRNRFRELPRHSDGTGVKVFIGAVFLLMFFVILCLLAKAAIFCDWKKKLKRFLKLLRPSGQENRLEEEEEEMMERENMADTQCESD